MSRFGDLVRGKPSTPPPAPEPVVESTPPPAPKRARDNSGHYIADDPSTPENEAWVGGASPKKKKRSSAK